MAYIPFLHNAYFTAKVGIGTDSPEGKLNIETTAESNMPALGANTTFLKISNTGGAYGAMIGQLGSGNSYIQSQRFDGTATAYNLLLQPNGGNVGIGTISPRYKLDLVTPQSTTQIADIVLPVNNSGDDSIGSSLMWKANYTGYTKRSAGIAHTAEGNYFRSGLAFYTNGSTSSTGDWAERMRIDMDGNVGIGTTSPIGMLSVVNPLSNSNTWTPTNNPDLWVSNAGTSNSYYAFGVTTNSGDIFSITNGGNVGIGTTGPQQLLHVYKSNAPAGIEIQGGLNTITAIGDVQAFIDFGTNDQSATGQIAGRIESLSEIANGAHNGLAFYTGQQSRTPYLQKAMQIRNTGAISFGSGSAAHGSSGQILKSNADASPTWVDASTVIGGPYLPLAGGTMTGNIDFVNNKDISMTDNAGAITRVMVLNTSNTMYIGPVDTYAGGSILYGVAAGVTFQRFFTGASERLRIGSNGNVAIGTTATSYRLQVEQDNDGNLLSRFHNTAANGQGLLIRAGGVSSANRILQLASENDTKVMTVNSNGRVGIGIANPTEKLEVVGNVLITAALLSNQENTDVDTGTETVASVAIATYTAAFFDFVVKKTTNVRSGTVYACHDGTSVVYTETSTNDLGDTSDVTLSVDISGTNMRLLATVTSDDWSVKSLIRAI